MWNQTSTDSFRKYSQYTMSEEPYGFSDKSSNAEIKHIFFPYRHWELYLVYYYVKKF